MSEISIVFELKFRIIAGAIGVPRLIRCAEKPDRLGPSTVLKGAKFGRLSQPAQHDGNISVVSSAADANEIESICCWLPCVLPVATLLLEPSLTFEQ